MKTPLPPHVARPSTSNALRIAHPSRKNQKVYVFSWIKNLLITKRLMTKKHYAWQSGYWAETLAAWYLRIHGYKILGKRVKTPYGEIDLIAARYKTLVIIEVKYRSTLRDAVYSLRNAQKKRILKAAQFLFPKHFKFELMRFDVILIMPWSWPHHLKNVRLQITN